ncbi:hypothetical protein HZS_8054 [Henneguya salminicola]|nr:hypothetical protein HZS_8054 [Henneguya salminicola]
MIYLYIRDARNSITGSLFSGGIPGQYHIILIGTRNGSLALLRYNSHTVVDSTFRFTQHTFTQRLIPMAYGHGTEVYVLCVYVSMTRKHEYLYSVVLCEVVVFNGAIKYEFTGSIVIGYYFHLKQALKQKFQKFKVYNTESYTILKNIELVALVLTEIIGHVIQYIKSLLAVDSNFENLWNYYYNTWLKKYEPSNWDINKVTNDAEFI